MDFDDFLKQLDSSYLREDLAERYRAMFRDGMSAEEPGELQLERGVGPPVLLHGLAVWHHTRPPFRLPREGVFGFYGARNFIQFSCF